LQSDYKNTNIYHSFYFPVIFCFRVTS